MKPTTVLFVLALAAPALTLPIASRGAAAKAQARGETASQDQSSAELELQRQAKAEQERKQKELASTYFKLADYDGNGWISFREARTSLDVDRTRFYVYDADQDGQVTLDEYTLVSLETYRRYGAFKAPIPDPDDPNAATLLERLAAEAAEELAASDPGYVPARADSINELFGQLIPRVRRANTVPEPDQLIGPVFPFRRLDYNDDGLIGRDDLDVLLLGAGIEVRHNALIASFDKDGDHKISEAEFFAAMGDTTR